MSEQQKKLWLPLVVIAVALVLWGVFIAAGIYWEPAADRPTHDVRKAWIVLAFVGGFLALWGLALWARSRRRGPP